ncbi:MAG: sigma-54 dependent transcriptional regulator [Terriglobia bacterium]
MGKENLDESDNPLAAAGDSGIEAPGQAASPLVIFAIDDDPGMLRFYKVALADEGVRVESSTDPLHAVELVETLNPDLTLLDLSMPGIDGMEALRRIRLRDPEARVVMITGDYSIETAVKAIQAGATDYVCKPITPEKVRRIVQETREHVDLTRRESNLEEQFAEVFSLEGMIGRSPRMLEVFDLVRRVAPHLRTALITGETGTGKELVARALHGLSPRAQQRIVVFNCSALVDTLAESQLFGHRKGAFTGAISDQAGIFEWANGGTVFLDEVGDLSPAAQSKLLRVLENGELQKLGLPQSIKVDVQVIAATSRDLNVEMKSNRFRPDLWYRLNMVQIQIPPLRERREDILLLARSFLRDFASQYRKEIQKISRRAESALLAHSWPGNVRELENVIGRGCMLTQARMLQLEDLPVEIRNQSVPSAESATTMEEAEKRAVIQALGETKNKALAARKLRISRARLYRLMAKYGLADDSPAEEKFNQAAGE